MSAAQDTSILIIDDDMMLAKKYAELFRLEGWLADPTFSGKEGIQKYQQHRHDVVLLDLMMFDMDGLEVIVELHRIDPDACVVFYTAYGSPEIAVKALKFSPVDMLEKGGLDFTLIFQKINTSLAVHRKVLEIRRLQIENERSRQALIRQEWLNRLLLGLSHQLGNHNTTLGHSLHTLKRMIDSNPALDNYKSTIGRAIGTNDRIDILLQELHNFAKSHEFTPNLIDLSTAVAASIRNSILRHDHHMTRSIHYELENLVAPNCYAWGHPVFIPMVLEAVLNNALEAVRSQNRLGCITVLMVDDGERIGVEVRDDGPGFPPQFLLKTLDLFETSKPLTNHGLGLVTADTVVKRCEGELLMSNRTDANTGVILGASVVILLLKSNPTPDSRNPQ